MEQEYTNWEEQPVSPFANSPYETPYTVEPAQPPKEKKTKKSKKRLTAVLLAVAILLAGCGLGMSAYCFGKMQILQKTFDNRLNVMQQQIEALSSSVGSGSAGQEGANQAPGLVYAKNVQAVVAISNQSLSTNFYGQVSETASSGSGFIISEDGYVVSNYHVIQGASKLTVITADSKKYDAKVIGYDAANDLSVLKIEATGLPYVTLGSSDALAVGDMVAAIGNPLGELTSTLTVGYISAKDRLVNTDGSYLNMLQTDAAINSGNSGGPLFNMQGEVVGITTAKYSGTSGSGAYIEGIGFAIPIDDVYSMIEDLVQDGYLSGAYMGVVVQDVSAEVADTYGLPYGAFVKEVEEGGAAEKAGIQAKDIIVNVGGHSISSMSELTRALRKFEPGQSTTVTVFRSGAQVNLEITFDEKPPQTEAEQETPQNQQQEQEQQQSQIPGFGGFGDWFGNFFPGFGG